MGAPHRFTVVFEPDPEGGFQVFVPAFPEICTYGRTLDEARAMAQDAIALAIESNLADGAPLPSDEQAVPPIELLEIDGSAA